MIFFLAILGVAAVFTVADVLPTGRKCESITGTTVHVVGGTRPTHGEREARDAIGTIFGLEAREFSMELLIRPTSTMGDTLDYCASTWTPQDGQVDVCVNAHTLEVAYKCIDAQSSGPLFTGTSTSRVLRGPRASVKGAPTLQGRPGSTTPTATASPVKSPTARNARPTRGANLIVPTAEPAEPIAEPTEEVMFGYDPEIGHTKKTNSYMPFMPVLDGYGQTHNTYRFFSVREQVLTVIGEAKHGLWRIHDNGMVRLYRKHGIVGVPVGADVNDPSIEAAIRTNYKPVLAPGLETGDAAGWGGYRYSQDADGDGQAAFVDVPIYHPYFDGKYEDHVPIDLPHWFCTMTGANFTNARRVWEYATKQPNANVVGPLGKRAGLDINEHYTNIIRFEMFPDAKFWVQVGMGDASKDVFDQSDIDDGSMSMDVAYRALDTSKVDMEVYLIERTFFNVPYIFVTTVIDNKENSDMRYTRPDGLYWQGLKERALTADLKTEMSFNPVMPVIDGDSQVDKVMRHTPFYGMNHLDKPNDDGSGGWCPQKGGDWGSYPTNPGGSGFPNEYEEATPVCDGLTQDIKMFANLDAPTWNSPTFQLANAGTRENPQVYLGEGNQYGEFTDAYNKGVANPHKLLSTDTENPVPKPVQKITVTFEGLGEVSKYVDPVTGQLMPAMGGLTDQEAVDREAKIAAAV
jgi:hypothetical protein